MELWGRVKQRMGDGVAAAKIRSGEALDAMKLKSAIAGLQKQKASAFEELGSIVYTLFRKGERDEGRVEAKCRAIAELDQQIEQNEHELERVHAAAEQALGKPTTAGVCECGAPLVSTAKFCGSCGKRLEPEP